MSGGAEERFALERRANVAGLAGDEALRARSLEWIEGASRHRYSYNFNWLGRPIIQFPQDVVAMQELIWGVRPDLVIETGVAHGGSLVLYASMLELIGGEGSVLGVDIDIRAHNRAAIEAHPMARRIQLLEGSSIDPDIVERVRKVASGRSRVMVVLDSNHTHEHVSRELELYAPLVKRGSYLVVMDTIIDDLPDDYFPERAWGPGDNPKTAVREFLRATERFEVDRELEAKLLITVAPGGYLRCVRD